MTDAATIADLDTPALLLERGKVAANAARVSVCRPAHRGHRISISRSSWNNAIGSFRIAGASTSISFAWLQPQCHRHTRFSKNPNGSFAASSRAPSVVNALNHSKSQSGCSVTIAHSSSPTWKYRAARCSLWV